MLEKHARDKIMQTQSCPHRLTPPSLTPNQVFLFAAYPLELKLIGNEGYSSELSACSDKNYGISASSPLDPSVCLSQERSISLSAGS